MAQLEDCTAEEACDSSQIASKAQIRYIKRTVAAELMPYAEVSSPFPV